MKTILVSLLALAVSTFASHARLTGIAPGFLDQKSETVIVAVPLSTKNTAEQIGLPHMSDVPVIGLSSEFEVIFVLKGDNSLKRLVVHHYRLANTNKPMQGGPNLVSFDPKESKRYLLFLHREPDGRYAPSDQVDPAATSIVKLNEPGWDKMKLADFREWLDAQKFKEWLGHAEVPPKSLFRLSPEIPSDGRGEGNLDEAALNGKLEKAKALLKANPNLVNSKASYANLTPLHLAVEYGHEDVAKLLLSYRADIEAEAYGGWTPLLNAVFGGHRDLVELLLKNKADVNVKEMAGRTPLHVAAENGYTEIAALLLTHKADVNAKNRDGLTPLHIAVALGYKDLVELLLANNADINARDNSGRTAVGFGVLHDNKGLAEMLRQRGGKE